MDCVRGRYDGNIDAYVIPADGGIAAAADVASRPRRSRGVDSGRQARAVRFRSRGLCGLHTALHRACWRAGRPRYCRCGVEWMRGFLRMLRASPTCPTFSGRAPRGNGIAADRLRQFTSCGLSDLALERVPRENSNDSHPVWVADTVYFLSDRNGPVTLFAYDTKSKTVKQLIENKGLDFKSLSAGPDALVYEQFGGIYLFDAASGKSRKLNVTIAGDLPATRAAL